MFALSNKKSTFALVSGFFDRCIVTVLLKHYLEGRFLTEKAPYTTIIIIFNAELHLFTEKNWLFGKFMWTKIATTQCFCMKWRILG